jgi:TPR repeat protein
MGVEQDMEQARHWLAEAANQDDPMALYNLGFLLDTSDQADEQAAALDYYTRAGNLGVVPAQLRLIEIHRQRQSGPGNTEQIIYWTRAAAEGGVLASQYNLAMILLGQEPQASVEAQQAEEAASWLAKAASSGHQPSMVALASLMLEGKGVTQDPAAAADWFLQASKAGSLLAQFNLGVLHEEGLGVEQDWVKAAKWYDHAANQDHPLAQWNLALMYDAGRGVPRSEAMAFKWFERAAEQGLADACLAVATFYMDGRLHPQDVERATLWLERAVRGGCEAALEPLEKIRNLKAEPELKEENPPETGTLEEDTARTSTQEALAPVFE